MAVAFDSVNSGSESSSVSSTSFSLTFVGTPTIVVITAGYGGATSTTVGGAAVTAITTGAAFSETNMQYCVSPANGNVVLTYQFSWRAVWGASAYTGSATSGTIIGVTGFATATSATASVTLTSLSANSLLVDDTYCATNIPTATGTGQTRSFTVIGSGGSSAFRVSSSRTTGVAGSQTVSYSLTSATWEMEVAEILPPGGTNYTTTPTETLVLVPSALNSTSRTLSETLTLGNVLTAVKVITMALSLETMVLTGTLIKGAGKVLSDTLSLTDSVLKGAARILSETLTLTATFTGVRVIARVLTETISLVPKFLANGTDVIWGHITRSADAVWTKINRN